MTRPFPLALVTCLTLAACAETGPGTQPATGALTRVLLTDAPFPFDLVQRADVYVSRIEASTTTDTIGGQGWQTLTEPKRQFELLALQGGTTALLGEGPLPVGQYRSLRVIIDTDQSRIVLTNGTSATVTWPRAGEITVHALVESPLTVADGGTQIVIDFDVGRSFLYQNGNFRFTPFLRAVDPSNTGSIGGTVTSTAAGTSGLVPADRTAVGVYRGDPVRPTTWALVATGRSDQTGRYSIHFIPVGSYVVQAEPTPGTLAGIVTRTGVAVQAGSRTTVDLTLPHQSGLGITIEAPVELAIGASATLRAVVTDDQGQPISDPPVTWSLSTPSFATLVPQGDEAVITGVATGYAAIRATSNALSDSVLVRIK